VTIEAGVVYITVPTTFWSTRTVTTTEFSTVATGIATQVVYTTLTIQAKRSLPERPGKAAKMVRDAPSRQDDIDSDASPWGRMRYGLERHGLLAKREAVTETMTSTVRDGATQTATKMDYHTSTTTTTETFVDVQYIGASTTITVTSTRTATLSRITETIVTEVTESGQAYLTTYTVTRNPVDQPLSVPSPGPTASPPNEPETPKSKETLSKGALIGIAAGSGSIALLAIAVVAICCWKAQQRSRLDLNRQSGMTALVHPVSEIHQMDPSVVARTSILAGEDPVSELASTSCRLQKSRVTSQSSSILGPETHHGRASVASTGQEAAYKRTNSAVSGTSPRYSGALGQPPVYQQHPTPQELYSEGGAWSNPAELNTHNSSTPLGGYSEIDGTDPSGRYRNHEIVEMQAGGHPIYEAQEMPGANQGSDGPLWIHELPVRR